jgi:hypothetical protein
MRAERREETATALREQLRAADAEIDMPDGLWERVRAPRTDITPAPVTAGPAGRRRPLPTAVMAVAAAAVAFVICGTWWLISPSTGHGPGDVQGAAAKDPTAEASDGAGRAGPITLRVHNAEKACRQLRTLECALRVAKSPYAVYADPGNSAWRVWHGDKLTASCVVTEGRTVTDEQGISSRRWYRVEKAGKDDGGKRIQGWLPGVRTRNSSEVRLCSDAEKPSG